MIRVDWVAVGFFIAALAAVVVFAMFGVRRSEYLGPLDSPLVYFVSAAVAFIGVAGWLWRANRRGE